MLGFEYVKIVFLSITLTLIFVAACVGLSILLSERVPSPVLFFSTVTLAGISSCLFWIVFSHLITTADSQYKLRSERGTANSNEAEARTK